MPSFATHHIFAATVQRVTGDAAAHTAALYPAAYRWGAQGPDPLYFYHAPFIGPVNKLAHRLHTESTAGLFEALCGAAVRQHNLAALAYVFGFCTHYALDRVAAPFILAQTERLAEFMPNVSATVRRQTVKTDLDCVLIREYITAQPAAFEAYRLLDPHAAECTVFAKTLSAAAKTAYGVRLPPATVYRALHDMRRALHLAHTGSHALPHLQRIERVTGKVGLASALIRPAEPLAADCANTKHRPWTADGQERTDSFGDLFDAAVPLAVSLQRAVLLRYYQQKPLDPRFFPTDFRGSKLKI